MNIDFIKWMCDKADIKFFCRSKDMIQYAVKIGKRSIEIGSNNWIDIVYPLLLQRAIEGVNRIEYGDYWFHQDDYITAWVYGGLPKTFKNKNIDQAKESALMYIYEQETKP